MWDPTSHGAYAWVRAGVFALALAVRLVYLAESSAAPTFDRPIVDAGNYDRMARTWVATGSPPSDLFWQPPFYPLFLSAVYAVSDRSILAARLIQVVLGAVACVLVTALGRRVFDLRVGAFAGVFAALYGPWVFLDAELVATGWECFWAVALVLLFLHASDTDRTGWFALLGCCAGLSTITRPTFVPFLLASTLWLLVALRRDGSSRRVLAARLSLMLVGFLAIAGPLGLLSRAATGRVGLFPTSGAINLFIGNNEATRDSIGVRPGWDWDQLTRLPYRHGAKTPAEAASFFSAEVLRFARTRPLQFAGGLAEKTVQFLCSRELPRNVDVYLFRTWSRVLGALTWKLGGFGFPFGLVLPLALVGLVLHRRRVPAPIWLFLATYPAAVIAVFVTARYRLPVIPVLLVLAAAACATLGDLVRGGHWMRLGAAGGMLLAVGLASTLAGPFPQERTDYAAEMDYLLGVAAAEDGDHVRALASYASAVARRPDYADAYNARGVLLQSAGDLDGAMEAYRRALAANPIHGLAQLNLGSLLWVRGDTAEGLQHLEAAVRLDPTHAVAQDRLGVALARSGALERAVASFRASLLLKRDADVLGHLGSALELLGRSDEAAGIYELALETDPGHRASREALDRLARPPLTPPAPRR